MRPKGCIYIRNRRGDPKFSQVSSSETNICTQKTEHRVPTLTISDEVDFSKVRTFLESIARNSESSKYAYEMGLT